MICYLLYVLEYQWLVPFILFTILKLRVVYILFLVYLFSDFTFFRGKEVKQHMGS